ncbi:MAG: gliding motility-associated C-terminal domain-containing protein [Chitinophagaceae bacterium]
MPGNITNLTLCFFLLSTLSLQSQIGNPCGLKAILSPAVGDSVVFNYGTVTFQSASINATDYKIIINDNEYALNTPVNRVITIGLNTVKLIAYNGNCSDTTSAYYFNPGQFPAKTDNPRRLYGNSGGDHIVTGLIGVTTGGHLLAGQSVYDNHYLQHGLLIKTKEAGCVDWAKKLVSIYPTEIKMVKEAADGGFFVFSTQAVVSQPLIAKLDAAGNTLWAKLLAISPMDILTEYAMDAAPDGGAVVTGISPYSSNSDQLVFRLDKNGNILWQKKYGNNAGGDYRFSNILIKDNAVYLTGSANYLTTNQFAAFILKMDLTSGQTIWLKKYAANTGTLVLDEIVSAGDGLLVNITAPTAQANTPVIVGFMKLDTAGQVLKASLVAENYIPDPVVGPYTTAGNHLIQSGGSFYLLSAGSMSLTLQPTISYATKLIKLDPDYNVLWVQKSDGYLVPRFFYIAPAAKEGLAIAGTESGYTLASDIAGRHLTLKVTDSAGGNPLADCFFGKQPFIIMPLTVTLQPMTGTTELPGNYPALDGYFPLVPFYPEMRFKCPDYVDSCSYLKVTGPQSVCDMGKDYQFKTHKNKGCGQPTNWRIPPGVQTIQQTDSSIILRFLSFGRYVVYGENLLSCTPVQDSLVVIVGSKTKPLDLGPDLQTCPQTITTLHAGKSYLSYEWQDGSSDSLFTTSQPGLYWVKVTDSCGNILRDTLTVSSASAVSISVGPDRTKCNTDTIHLQAPVGFLNYTWSPAYAISATSGQEVIVNPKVDTLYTIIVEKAGGCFGYDSIKITVKHSPAIQLGNDTSFCAGDSAVLNAGNTFNDYLWSNGAISQQLSVFNANTYSVMATTIDGCKTYDTIKIITVFVNPVVKLDNDSTLCTETKKILSPGNFSSYQWQDGSNGPSYSVTALGKYYVKVTDSHHCTSSDTIIINRLAPGPSKFLPPDTGLCNYGGKLELKPTRSYNQYLWSNGATTATINIIQPGIYWLQATDEHNCAGKDSIIVRAEDCMIGFYVPSAFSPNHDGKNDIFRPLLFGNIKSYHFTIYNRWGQLVFDATDPAKGWDGNVNGQMQNINIFIWTCSYQFEGQELLIKKGTVTLIK